MARISHEVKIVGVGEIRPYDKNPRKNEKAVAAVAESIKAFGFKVPIVVDKDNVIIAGHTRLKAAQKLGYKTVPIIVADDLTPEQVRAYRLADNRVHELSEWDDELLAAELEALEAFGMEVFGFSELSDEEDDENEYSQKVDAPQYTPTGADVGLGDLCDTGKYSQLLQDIENAAVPDDVKTFLKHAAARHIIFDYQDIAEYYAQSAPDIQRLFEASALVIIDYNDAIKNGYVLVKEQIEEQRLKDAEQQ